MCTFISTGRFSRGILSIQDKFETDVTRYKKGPYLYILGYDMSVGTTIECLTKYFVLIGQIENKTWK